MVVTAGTTLANAFKIRWLSDKVHNHAWRRESIMRDMKAVRRDFSGKEPSFLIETYPGEEGVFQAESATLNTAPTDEGYTRGYFSFKTMISKRHVSVEALEDGRDVAGSLVRPMKQLPKAVIDNQVFHLSRNAWCDEGKIAVCATTTSSATLLLNTKSNMRRFKRRMTIDCIDSADGASAAAQIDSEQILTVTEGTAPSVTVTSTATLDTNDVICFEDESYDNSDNYGTRAWNGLPNLVGTGDVCNVTTSTSPEYRSKVDTSTGTLTLQKMQDVVDWIEARSPNPISKIYMSPEVAGKYGGLLIPDIRFTDKLLNRMEGGQVGTNLFFKGGSMGTIPIQRDPLMPKDEIFFITWPSFQLATTAFLKWMNLSGTMFHFAGTTLAWILVMYSRGELGVLQRNCNGKMTGVTI